jgi:hypothetical protein
MTLSRFSRSLLGCVLGCVCAASTASAWVPNSGDVDDDGRLTTRDAVLIFQSLTWPERARLHDMMAACDYTRDGQCDAHDAEAVLAVVVTNPNDIDGDGVPNTADCDPFDDRIATPHTYYLDRDRDQTGDFSAPFQLCTVTPFPPVTAWGGDPDDYTAVTNAVPVPKNGRTLAVDFETVPADGVWRPEMAKELGAEATTLQVPWSVIETSPGTFNGAAVQQAGSAFAQLGLKVSLTISPISGQFLTMPDDLRVAIATGQMRLRDAAVINRFKAMLTFVHAQLPQTQLVSLQIGHNVDEFLRLCPSYFWSDYAVFVQAAAAHARTLWGSSLPIGITATASGLLQEPTWSQLLTLNQSADIISLTYLPVGSGFTAVDPRTVRTDFERLLMLYASKPLYVQSLGYPSAPVTGSSETMQSQFYLAFFGMWDAWAARVPFAAIVRLYDYSPERSQLEAFASGGSAAAVGYHGSLGLRTHDGRGRAKAAYKTVRTQAFNRGWWAVMPSTSRPFHLGFTPAPYDYPEDPAQIESVAGWIASRIGTDATLINIHMDAGVPWPEAYADTFASSDLPYSPAVKGTWSTYRAHVPPGHQVVISINPLGVPRDLLAPYFGVGEGFTYDDQFHRIPDGQVKDAPSRVLPAPWDTYDFDDPHVKQAFLSFAKRAIQFFQPDYLLVTIEASATLNEDPAKYDKYLALQAFVYQQLKADPAYRHVPIGVSVSATSFMVDEYGVALKWDEVPDRKRLLQVQGLLDLAPFVDFIALSYYPHYGRFDANQILASSFDELIALLARTRKPIAVSETGWPGESFTLLGYPFRASPEQQAAFYRHLLYELEKSLLPIEFVVSFQVRDNDYAWERLRQKSLLTPPEVSPMFVEFYKYFRDIGLYDGDGVPRPSSSFWLETLAKPYVPRPPIQEP